MSLYIRDPQIRFIPYKKSYFFKEKNYRCTINFSLENWGIGTGSDNQMLTMKTPASPQAG